ncbi:MAG: site-specific DNA-methyltransferase [Rhodothermaceae bacterium]|nr:site-specific DNA-methyltransferase [Rhodothermaceae bacterium]MYE61996.1 site-specific DNA-methyltransferase [Rhodothermaceae bacterium]MYJ19563.1 site-specific DNA-methyltransferase [Rhodothermaceae bacterium]
MTENQVPRINITSPDMNAERLAELHRIMPDLFDGEGQLDEASVRQLFPSEKIGGIEKYRFEWVGKQESKHRAFTPSRATLVADKGRSVNYDQTKNLFIEGDNLEVLKLLKSTYFEQVKCIYIDPPYNTGSDFIYPDNYAEKREAYWQKSGIIKDGVKLVALTETSGRRHSEWLSMMQSRLYAARSLLREDGVVIIHIDENEGHRLRMLLEDVFGPTNFLGEIIWDKRNPKGDSGKVSYQHESVLLFAKNLVSFREHNELKFPKRNAEIMLKKAAHYFSFVGQKTVPPRVSEALNVLGLNETQDYEEEYTLEDANQDYQKWLAGQGTTLSGGEAAYKHIDDEGKVFQTVSMAWPNNKQAPREYFMPLQHPVVGKPCPVPAKGWRNPPGTMKKLLDQGRIVFGVDETTQPRRKYILEENMSENLASLLYYGSSDDASLKKMGIRFENPKPVEVAKRLMTGVVGNGDLVLDFFAGSGTAGQAIMEMNSENHKNVRFILVQIPEHIDKKHIAYKAGHGTIAALCIDRLKKAGRRITEVGENIPDVGFRVYRLTESYFPENRFKFDPSKSEKENIASLREHLEVASQSRIFDENEIADIITEISLKNGYGLFYTLEHLDRRFPGN